ncbi:PAS domain-containing sensor histidine kinase [Pedobacter sp. SYSU D00535]|uniref:PAS domain-containing sensor histidine kinase n=1 Tax=Pedobacter sp. SYSU D00535 TaxID=2810308 RepID=UPI001A971297|nr:PAS domain-containing sensor histidine kinase [Pedobacter sp. SYSU D00535]
MVETVLKSQLLKSFFDKASIGIKIIDPQGIIIYANEAELGLLGLSSSEYLGQCFFKFFASEEEANRVLHALEKDQEEEFFTKLIRRDRSIIDVCINTSISKDEKGIPEGICCFTRDITSYKRDSDLLSYLNILGAELALTYDTQTTLDKVAELIVPRFASWFFIDVFREGRIDLLKVGHQDPAMLEKAYEFRQRHPVTIEDSYGVGKVLRTGETSFTPVVHEFSTSSFPADIAEDLRQVLNPKSVIVVPMIVKERITGAISFILTGEGSFYEVSDISFAKDFANRIGLALENARLYEETQREIAHRVEAEQKKDEFISMASHELKTPLTSIKAYNQIIEKKVRDNEEVFKFVNKAAAHISQLERLISDLLDVSKINAGKLTYNISNFDFNRALRESVESVQHTAPTHQILIEETADVVFRGDKLRIEQVIINFLTNAIKYSPKADKVIVRSRVQNDNIIVSIQDFGIGIEKENLNKLFDRFYRVENSAMKYSGLGLGLFIASEILHGHQGSFWIESEPGKGSTFFFCLPLHNKHHQPPISQQFIYKDGSITVEFKPAENIVEACWSGFQTIESINKGVEEIARIIQESNCVKVLNDNTEVQGNWSQAADEGRHVWVPTLEQAGLRYFAWVQSPSSFSQLSAMKTASTDLGKVVVRFFENADQAKAWLKSVD